MHPGSKPVAWVIGYGVFAGDNRTGLPRTCDGGMLSYAFIEVS